MERNKRINPHNPADSGVRVKILIATGIYPPDIGGPATMLGALADSLSQRNFFVKVITYSEKSVTRHDYGRSIKVYRVAKNSNRFGYIKYFLKLLQLSFWADIIYVTETYSVGYFVYLIKKVFRRKIYSIYIE